MGGGVVTFLESISRRQAEAGAIVSVLYAVRPDTPDRQTVEERIGAHATILPHVLGNSTPMRALLLFAALRGIFKNSDYDTIHLHSSVAGFVGRAARLTVRRPSMAVYSPHGFAFLRQDTSRLTRFATRAVESVLAGTGPLILTSQSEREIAEAELHATLTALLQSGVPSESIPASLPSRRKSPSSRPRVLMVGRLAYQKAPWRFAHVANELRDLADFIWVGSGTQPYPAEWIGAAPVQLIPWVTPEDLEDLIDGADVMLFPSLWEGMSLSLIQAQSRGLPCVTTDVVGNRDAVVHGQTGYVCDSDADLVSATRTLIQDEDLRERMGEAAKVHAKSKLVDDAIGTDSLALYTSWTRTAEARKRSE